MSMLIQLGTETDYIDLTDMYVGGTFTVALPSVGLVLDLTGDSVNDVQRTVNRINRFLTRAAESARPHGHGERIELRFRFENAPWAYCDVTGGILNVPATTITGAHLLGAFAWYQNVSLGLTCLPLGRLDPITYDESATLTHGDVDAVYVVGNIPGDAPALCELSITDESASDIVQRWRVAVRSGVALELGDFTFRYDAVTGDDGTETGEGGTIGGEFSRVTTTTTYQQVATANIADRGLVEIMARVRDSSVQADGGVVEWGNNGGLRAGTTGTLAAGTYRVVIVAMNGANVVAVSEPRTIVLSGFTTSDAIVGIWDAATGATDYRVYYKFETDPYAYQSVGSATATYTLTTTAGSTVGNPPSVASVGVQYARMQALVSLSHTNVPRTPPYVTAAVGNDLWEDVTIYKGAIPPQTRSEHRDDFSTRVSLNARASSSDSVGGTLDVDAFYVLPLDGYGMTVEFPERDLATANLTWRMETNRDGHNSAYIPNAGVAVPVNVLDGALYLEPFPQVNLIFVMATVAGGVSSLGADFTVQAKVTPRWRTLGGAVPV